MKSRIYLLFAAWLGLIRLTSAQSTTETPVEAAARRIDEIADQVRKKEFEQKLIGMVAWPSKVESQTLRSEVNGLLGELSKAVNKPVDVSRYYGGHVAAGYLHLKLALTYAKMVEQRSSGEALDPTGGWRQHTLAALDALSKAKECARQGTANGVAARPEELAWMGNREIQDNLNYYLSLAYCEEWTRSGDPDAKKKSERFWDDISRNSRESQSLAPPVFSEERRKLLAGLVHRSPTNHTQVWITAGIGVAFLVLAGIMALTGRFSGHMQEFVLRTVLAVGVACIGVLFTGSVDLIYGKILTATGTCALFALIYLVNPPPSGPTPPVVTPPAPSPSPPTPPVHPPSPTTTPPLPASNPSPEI